MALPEASSGASEPEAKTQMPEVRETQVMNVCEGEVPASANTIGETAETGGNTMSPHTAAGAASDSAEESSSMSGSAVSQQSCPNVDTEFDTGPHDVPYFRRQVERVTTELNCLCDKWDSVGEQEELSEDGMWAHKFCFFYLNVCTRVSVEMRIFNFNIKVLYVKMSFDRDCRINQANLIP